MLVDEGGELVDVVFQLGLGAEHLAHTQRAIAAFQVALEGGEELQFDAAADDGIDVGNGGPRVAEANWMVWVVMALLRLEMNGSPRRGAVIATSAKKDRRAVLVGLRDHAEAQPAVGHRGR
jgi:hypothetical protein